MKTKFRLFWIKLRWNIRYYRAKAGWRGDGVYERFWSALLGGRIRILRHKDNWG